MKYSITLSGVLLLSSFVLGQQTPSNSLPDAPSKGGSRMDAVLMAAEASRPDFKFVNSSVPVEPALHVVLPKPVTAAPKEPRILDKKFIALIGVSSALTILDVELTASCLRSNRCVEANPLYGSNPTRARMYGISLPLMGSQTLISAWLRHRYPTSKMWLIPMLSGTAAHGVGAATGLANR